MPFYDNIKYLCEEQSHAFDLPVLKEGVTYKNVFCFICNRNINVENDELTEYKIMEFNIICHKQFYFMYKINLHEMLQGAEEQNCDVVLNTKEVALCDTYATSIISTCKNKVTHTSVQWACEKLDRHSLPPVHQYKNEFCEICNEKEHFLQNETYVGDANYAECNKSNKMQVQYENACRYLPKMAFHRNISPDRKTFCSFCVHKDHRKEDVHSHYCEPIYGDNLHFAIRLIRNLFSPGLMFNSEISFKSLQVGQNITIFPVKSFRFRSKIDISLYLYIACFIMFIDLHTCTIFVHILFMNFMQK
jgi:hypothetical protein